MRYASSVGRFRTAGILVALLMGAGTAHAQAWVPAKGEGNVSVLFSNVLSKDHFLPDERVNIGHIQANTLLFDLTYGITDQMALSIGLPVVVSRYTGGRAHGPPFEPVTLDDGAWHTTAQDFRFGLRYNVRRSPLVLTPFVGVIVPSHGYEYFAHAAPGRRRREVMAGVSAAKLLAGPGLVLQGRYALGIGERVVGISPRYSDGSAEVAYFVGRSARVFGMVSGRRGHSGIDLTRQTQTTLPFEIFRHHDRIAREHALNVGAGAAVSITDSTDLLGSYTRTVTGRNTHAVNRGVSIGIAWSFRRSGSTPAQVADGREGSLRRCLCEKAVE